MHYRVYDIEYDTDGEQVELPSEMVLELGDEADPGLELADAVSDKTGFCVKVFRFEEAPSPGPSP